MTFLDGRHGEAIDVIRQILGKDLQPDDSSVVKMKHEIDEAVRLEEADGPWRFSEVFKNGPFKIRRRFLLVIGVWIPTLFMPCRRLHWR